MRNTILALAITPYLATVSVDFWFHKSRRKVPATEFRWHIAAGISIFLFFAAVFGNYNLIAGAILPIALMSMGVDEVRFHKNLSTKEKQIHYIAGTCLLIFVVTWLWMTF